MGDSFISASSKPSSSPPANAVTVNSRVFLAAVVTISGNWSRAMSTWKNCRCSPCQSATSASTTTAATSTPYMTPLTSRCRVLLRSVGTVVTSPQPDVRAARTSRTALTCAEPLTQP